MHNAETILAARVILSCMAIFRLLFGSSIYHTGTQRGGRGTKALVRRM